MPGGTPRTTTARILAIGGLALAVVASGCSSRSSSANPQPDPTVRVASSVVMLKQRVL